LVKDKGRYAGAWNFGPLETDAISVEEIVKRVISYWGTGKYTVRHQKNQPPEARSLRLDCSKAHELMGWKSTYGIDKALKETVAWYKEFYKKPVPGKLYDYTAKQIAKYLGKSGLYSDVLAPSKDGGHR
jgi:CDP-glucose 4,6-dehydratase